MDPKMINELFGGDFNIIAITNPSYPLKFERFGEADPKDDPEMVEHLEKCYFVGNSVSKEMWAMPNVYSNELIYKAEERARKAYSARNPVKEAKAALSISPYCPEAYNVLAQMGANTYEEALDYYNKAVEIAPKISPTFASDVSDGHCWRHNHLRSYFRAIHGQANTLRKMGRYKEALKKYLKLEKLDKDFHSWISFANWRYHVLEVYMKLGDDEGAVAFASKKSNHEAFRLASSAGAWLWSMALLDYRYKQRRGFAREYYDYIEEMRGPSVPPVGAIISASQASRNVLSFLTGERKLPDCKIPYTIKSESSLSNAALYCMSNLELWRNTPGAIEWAATNCNTHYCLLMLRNEVEILKHLNITNTVEVFQEFIKKGVFLEASIPGFGSRLLCEAIKADDVEKLNVLLDSGAKVFPDVSSCTPKPLHIACYYDHDPEIIRTLCRYGANPADKYELHYSPIQMAAEQGAARALKTAISCLPKDLKVDRDVIMDEILLVLFKTSCYDCITGIGPKCQRCNYDNNPHPKNASFNGCVDAVMETGYIPSKSTLTHLHQVWSFKPELFEYIFNKAIKVSPSLASLAKITSDEAWKRICSVCGKEDIKTMMCSACHSIRYCSRQCQKANWKIHKRICY